MLPEPASLLRSALLASCLVACADTALGADPPRDAAKQHAVRGQAAYNLGHYGEAVTEYEAAYRLVQNPVLLYNIGQAYRLDGKPEKALAAYRAFLRTASEDAENREAVKKRVGELEALIADAQRSQGAPPQGTLAVRERNPDATPERSPGAAAPSSHDPNAAPASATLASDPSDTAGKPPVYQRWWFWAGLAVVVAAGTVAVLAGGGDDRLATDCGRGVVSCVGVPK
jgi:tetratricopeptide (TPR) repeat protein